MSAIVFAAINLILHWYIVLEVRIPHGAGHQRVVHRGHSLLVARDDATPRGRRISKAKKEGKGIAMATQIRLNPKLVVARIMRATNERDIDALVECFDPLYYGEQPAHPDRTIRGRERIRAEWSAIFSRVPDFKAEVLRHSADGDVTWVEQHWSGTRPDKTKLEMRGVAILGVRAGRVIWSRLYIEPVRQGGAGFETFVEEVAKGLKRGRSAL